MPRMGPLSRLAICDYDGRVALLYIESWPYLSQACLEPGSPTASSVMLHLELAVWRTRCEVG